MRIIIIHGDDRIRDDYPKGVQIDKLESSDADSPK
jgi:hypothetical protein